MADGCINQFVGYGTTAERLAFVPDPPSPAFPPGNGYVYWDTTLQQLFAWDVGGAAWVLVSGGGSGITQLTGPVTAGPGSGSQATTIANDAITTAKILNGNVTLAKIANAAANNKLLGSGAAGAGSPYAEITLGSNLSMAGTTLNAAGASGNGTTTSPYASPPGSPTAGDLWLPTDSAYLLRYSGSAQVPWGPLFPFTLPVEADYTWDNQGSATVDDAVGPLRMSMPAHAGLAAHVLYKAAPSTPYTITIAMIPMLSNAAVLGAGLTFRQSSDGKLSAFFVKEDAVPTVDKWNSSIAFSAGYTELGALRAVLGGLNFLRIADNGTDRICSISYDGIYWYPVHTVGRTDFLTADQVGLVLISSNGTTTNIAAMTVLSWVQA